MGKETVYEGLKNALRVRNLPYAGLDEKNLTILFKSWEQYKAFDTALTSIPTPNDIKLCIYAEKVEGRSDGVAVTVSDEIQRLTYWDTYPNMQAKVNEFEEFISRVLRLGVEIFNYNYYTFVVEFDDYEYFKFSYEFKKNPSRFVRSKYYISRYGENEKEHHTFHFDFSG